MEKQAATPPAESPAKLPARLDARDKAVAALLSLATLALAGAMLLSLRWEIVWDAMTLHRIAFLIAEHGRAPYTGVFDVNMFGIYWLHIAVGKLCGWGDFPLRVLDVLWLTATCGATYGFLRRTGWQTAWCGAVAFGWFYVNQLDTQALQREYLLLLPIALAAWLAVSPAWREQRRGLRWLAYGLLLGCAVSLKPNALVALPVLCGFEVLEHAPRAGNRMRRCVIAAACLMLGLAIPLGAGALWLWSHGSLSAFFDLAMHYWPVYTRLGSVDRVYVPLEPAEHWRLRIHHLLVFHNLETMRYLVPLAAAALWVFMRSTPNQHPARKPVVLATGLGLVFLAQVFLVGHFHNYSWMPFLWCLSMLVALGLAHAPEKPATQLLPRFFARALPWACLGALLIAATPLQSNLSRQVRGEKPSHEGSGLRQQLGAFLKERLRPGDVVQPLDFLGGSHAPMLDLRLDQATFVVEDVYLRIHVTDPYVIELRECFLRALESQRPRFVVEVLQGRVPVKDRADDGSFDRRLHNWLHLHYIQHLTIDRCIVWELKKPAQ